MLCVVSEVPQTPQQWAIFSFHHQLSHRAIADAIFARNQIVLTNYVLDPMPTDPDQLPTWLEQNQFAHRDFNAILGTASLDLSVTDFEDPRQREAWIFTHYNSHLAAESTLKI